MIETPRFMGFVRMAEGTGTPPQELFEAMDAYVAEQAAKGVFLDGEACMGPRMRSTTSSATAR